MYLHYIFCIYNPKHEGAKNVKNDDRTDSFYDTFLGDFTLNILLFFRRLGKSTYVSAAPN